MGIAYTLLADGFEEIEVLTTIDTLRRVGLDVEIVSVTPDGIVAGIHDVSVLCSKNFENCDFFNVELLFLPGGIPDAAALDKHEGVCKLAFSFTEKNKPITIICAALMVLGKLGLLRGRRITCYLDSEQYPGGAECTNEPVVRDGSVITSMGPGAAVEFVLTIVDTLLGKEKINELVEAICVRRWAYISDYLDYNRGKGTPHGK